MGMKKKRGVLSLLFVFLWVFLFFGGMYVVFLFLQGFSFFDSRVLQKGYASFVSRSPLYLNSAFIENSGQYMQYELGKYDVCAREFGKKERCYNDVEVEGNDKVSQVLGPIFLTPKKNESLSIPLSGKDDKIAFSKDNGTFLWYDASLRQAFYVEIGKSGVQSVFPEFEVVSVEYDEKEKRFVLGGKKEKEVLYIDVDSMESSLFFTLSRKKYDFKNYYFEYFDETLIGVFLEEMQHSYKVDDGKFVLFFDDSVYLFSSVRNSFRFISRKDTDFGGVCSVKAKRCFYKKDGVFRFIQL